MMARVNLLAGNWKMHKTRTEALAFASELDRLRQGGTVDTANGYPELLVCAPYTALPGLYEPLEASGTGLGAQNMHEADIKISCWCHHHLKTLKIH